MERGGSGRRRITDRVDNEDREVEYDVFVKFSFVDAEDAM